MGRTGPFQWGDVVQLTGPKQRMHTIVLTEGASFGTQHGARPHADFVGLDDGSLVTVGESAYLAIRPLLHDYVMSMPRGAAIIYPKDAAHIVGFADVHPDLTVVEAGVGSGALSLWLLRALHGTGRLVSFEQSRTSSASRPMRFIATAPSFRSRYRRSSSPATTTSRLWTPSRKS